MKDLVNHIIKDHYLKPKFKKPNKNNRYYGLIKLRPD